MDVVLQELRIPTLKRTSDTIASVHCSPQLSSLLESSPPSVRPLCHDGHGKLQLGFVPLRPHGGGGSGGGSLRAYSRAARKAATVNASRLAASFAPLINDLLQVQASFLVGDTNLGEADAQQLRDYLAEGREVLAQAEEEIANFSPNLCWGQGAGRPKGGNSRRGHAREGKAFGKKSEPG